MNDNEQIMIGTHRFRRVNIALFCAGFVTFVSLYDVQPLLPLFTTEFGVSPAMASLPLSITTCSLALAMLLTGTVSETLGRKPVMVLSLLLASLLTVLTFFSHGFASLLAVRLLQGIVLAGIPSVAMAYLGEEMDGTAIAPAMGLYISGNALGGMTGRIGSALLADYLPWRLGILVIGLLCLLLSTIAWKSLPPSRHFHRRPFQVGYLVTSLGLHLRDRGMLCLYGVAFFSMGGFVTLYNYLGFRLQAPPYSYSQSTVSLIFLVYLLGSFSSSVMGGLLNRFGRAAMIGTTLTGMLVGTLLTLSSSVAAIVTGVGLFTGGFFGIHAIASSWVGRRAKSARAQASSLYLFAYYLGSSISGTAGGLFWSHYGWWGVAALIGVLVIIDSVVARALLTSEKLR